MYTVTVITPALSYSIDLCSERDACETYMREKASVFSGAVFLIDNIRSAMLKNYVV